MLLFAATIIALQLAAEGCVTDYKALNDPTVRRDKSCSKTSPTVWACGSAGTTVTLEGGHSVVLRAPRVNSQIVFRCPGYGDDLWVYCDAGDTASNDVPQCKNGMQVWSAIKTRPWNLPKILLVTSVEWQRVPQLLCPSCHSASSTNAFLKAAAAQHEAQNGTRGFWRCGGSRSSTKKGKIVKI